MRVGRWIALAGCAVFGTPALGDVLPPPDVARACPENSHREPRAVAACAGDAACIARLPCISDFSGTAPNVKLKPIGPSMLPGTPPLEGTAIGN